MAEDETPTVAERLGRIEAQLKRLIDAWETFEPVVKELTAGPARAFAAARRMRQRA